MLQRILRGLRALRFLRLLLYTLAITILLLRPAPGTSVNLHDWHIVSTLLAPAVAPIIFMLLMLDLLMARIFASDATSSDNKRLRYIGWFNLGLAILMGLRWAPYYLAIGG